MLGVWLKRIRVRRGAVIGVASAAVALSLAWLAGSALNQGPVSARLATLERPTPPAAAVAPAALAAQPDPAVNAQVAALMDAKFDTSNAADAVSDEVAAAPPPPAVAAVAAPPIAAQPAPEPMVVAPQTDIAPVAVAAASTKASYFTHGAPSAQHLPMP